MFSVLNYKDMQSFKKRERERERVLKTPFLSHLANTLIQQNERMLKPVIFISAILHWRRLNIKDAQVSLRGADTFSRAAA